MINTRFGSEVEFIESREVEGGLIEVKAKRSNGTMVAEGEWIPLYEFRADDGLNELIEAATLVAA